MAVRRENQGNRADLKNGKRRTRYLLRPHLYSPTCRVWNSTSTQHKQFRRITKPASASARSTSKLSAEQLEPSKRNRPSNSIHRLGDHQPSSHHRIHNNRSNTLRKRGFEPRLQPHIQKPGSTLPRIRLSRLTSLRSLGSVTDIERECSRDLTRRGLHGLSYCSASLYWRLNSLWETWSLEDFQSATTGQQSSYQQRSGLGES
jgi:hypothetical protein